MRTGGRARRASVAAVVLAALTLVGCAPSSVDKTSGMEFADQSDVHQIEYDSVERSYIAHVPDDAAIGAPLTLPVLVVLHGAGGNALKAETATGLTTYAKADDFIIVYPNGTQAADIEGQLAWNAGACCGVPKRTDVDDVGFIEAVLDDVQAKYAVDTGRIYLAGFSNGGMMSYRLSCELGDRIAGIAVVSGAFNVSSCESEATTDVLIVHGTGDLTVPYKGGLSNERTAARFGQWSNKSVADAAKVWIARDDCDDSPDSETRGSITRQVYADCADDTELEVISIKNGQHVWPLAPNSGFDASETIVEFFGLDT
jgi:polyhydroxybutyrate depolymerase